MKKCAIYTRVSTSMQAEKEYTPPPLGRRVRYLKLGLDKGFELEA